MKTKFEVGKKYKHVDGEILECIAIIQTAKKSNPVIMVDESEWLSRYTFDGRVSEGGPIRIKPEEYVPPFEPKIGVWRTRGGREVKVEVFRADRVFPLRGTHCWDEDGCILSKYLPDEMDLIEYLRPLPKEQTDWEACKKAREEMK